MKYNFKWKRTGILSLSQKREVIGHKHIPEQDKMLLYKEDGGIEEIVQWHKCAAILGVDWVLAIKKDMESKTGQNIPLNVGK